MYPAKKPSPRQIKNLELQNTEVLKPEGKCLLGIDYGEKFCGLALSPDSICVVPLEIIATEKLLSRIPNLLNKKCVQKVIVGLPFYPDGTENPLCQDIKKIAEKISTLVPIKFVNERFSSKSVITPHKNERIDDLSATKILEFYLDKK